MDALRKERDSYKIECEKQAFAETAKLKTDKVALQQRVNDLEIELKQTPESLSAQVHSLTDLTEMLSKYLTDHFDAADTIESH